jgi:hypothetical protein
MTTRIKIQLESIAPDVEIDVELWTSDVNAGFSPRLGTQQSGRRKGDYKFSRVLQTLSFPKSGLSEYVYNGQVLVIRERDKNIRNT